MFCCILPVAVVVLACSEAPTNRASKHESRGDDYVQQEKFREAVIDFKTAAQATPDNPALQWKLAKAALQTGDGSTAYLALTRVRQLDPSHFDAKWSLGDLYLAAGQMEEAGKMAEELVTANPRHPGGHLLRAGVALGAGRVAEAIELLKHAAELDPAMVRPLLAVGHIYFVQPEQKMRGSGTSGPSRPIRIP